MSQRQYHNAGIEHLPDVPKDAPALVGLFRAARILNVDPDMLAGLISSKHIPAYRGLTHSGNPIVLVDVAAVKGLRKAMGLAVEP